MHVLNQIRACTLWQTCGFRPTQNFEPTLTQTKFWTLVNHPTPNFRPTPKISWIMPKMYTRPTRPTQLFDKRHPQTHESTNPCDPSNTTKPNSSCFFSRFNKIPFSLTEILSLLETFVSYWKANQLSLKAKSN